MASPAYSIIFSAQVSGAASSGGAGDPLIPTSAGGLFVLATAAARGTRRTTGIALGTYGPSQPVEIQQQGTVDYATFNMGAGAASWVRVSAAGGLERCTPSGSDDVVGWCDADGTLHLSCGVLTAGMTTASGPGGGQNAVQYNNNGNFAGATQVTTNGIYLGISNGAPIATTGELRLSNSGTISARNGTNSGNLQVVTTNASNQVLVGESGGGGVVVQPHLSVGATPATTGTVRLDVNAAIYADNGAGTGTNLPLVELYGGANLLLGTTNSYGTGSQCTAVNAYGSTSFNAGVGSTTYFSADATRGANIPQNALTFGSSGYSTTGAIRLKNNTAVKARNSTSSGDLQIVATNASDQVLVGESGGSGVVVQPHLAVGATTATVGSVRIPNASSLQARNGTNSGDLAIIDTNASNALFLGHTSAYANLVAYTLINGVQGGNVYENTSPMFSWGAIGAGAGLLLSCVPHQFGTSSAASGQIRLPNNTSINAKKAASGDITVIGTNTSDQVTIGAAVVGAGTAQGSVNAVGTQAMADANQTPAATVYACAAIKTTGALTATRTLTLPTATDAQGYAKWINNTCSGAFSVTVQCAAGTTVAVANGKSALVWVDSRGVTRMTADV